MSIEPQSTPTPRTYGELEQAYDHFNRELFDGELPACLMTLQREKRTYGYFSSARFGHRDGRTTDEIALNPAYFARVPLLEILQTLVHEMTHLWQSHFGEPGRGRYHNNEWANKMEALGLMPSSTGRPGGARVGDHMADYMIPGGRFAAAVEVLLREGRFEISWYDRYVAPAPLYETTKAEEADGIPEAALQVPAEVAENVIQPPGPSSSAVASELGDRSNRVRYVCPGCGLKAWAKPDAPLGCWTCQRQMVATSSARAHAGRSVTTRAARASILQGPQT